MNSYSPEPAVPIMLDGFGYNESSEYSIIAAANTPTWTQLSNTCPPHILSDAYSLSQVRAEQGLTQLRLAETDVILTRQDLPIIDPPGEMTGRPLLI